MPSREKLAEFAARCQQHITVDEKGQAQIFLDRLFQTFGQAGCLDVGGTAEFRIRKAGEDGGGTAFADYVWKPVVLIEMKRRGGCALLLNGAVKAVVANRRARIHGKNGDTDNVMLGERLPVGRSAKASSRSQSGKRPRQSAGNCAAARAADTQ